MRIKGLRNFTLIQGGGGVEESGDASSPYGPRRAGLTTSQPTNKVAQLSGLLNDLERKTDDLEYRYLEVLGTFLSVMNLLVERGAFTKSTDTTKEEEC